MRSREATGTGSVKQDVGERGASNVTPVREALLRVIVAWVVRVFEDVPIDSPGGSTVDNMAGEKVPKLMSAVDESKPGIVVARLRSTDKESGTPEVERSEEVAVGVMVSESTPMTVSSAESSDELGVEELEDRSGPRPSDKVMTEAVAEELFSLLLDVVSGNEPRVVRAVDRPWLEEDMVVSLPGVPLSATPGVKPDTTPGVESVTTLGAEVVVDRDRRGWSMTC